MKGIFFLEDYDPLYDYKGKEILSLDPRVSYFFNENDIKYHILEDFYDENDLICKEEEYFTEQLEYFIGFDEFLKGNISYCKIHNIPLSSANYLRLKYLIDTVVVSSYILSCIFEKRPDIREVIYVHKMYEDDSKCSIYTFVSDIPKNRKVFCDLLQLFCEKYNIKFTEQLLHKEDALPKESTLQSSVFNTVLKNSFIKPWIKAIYTLIKYKKSRKLLSSDSFPKNLNFFFMHAGSLEIDYPITELIRNKAHIYLKEGDKIIREDMFVRHSYSCSQLEKSFIEKMQLECRQCASALERLALISWINNKCQSDVSSVVLPFLKHFVSEDCFYILSDTERMLRFYKQYKIDYVFARANTDRNSIGAIIAARYGKGAKSVCIQHACFAHRLEAVALMDTETYDYTLTTDPIAQKYYEYFLKNKYRTNCRPIESAHYLRNVKRFCSKSTNKGKREKVLYVVRTFVDRLRCLNNMNYPLTWYYEFLRRLVDYFAQEKGFDFVYKHVPGQIWAENSIVKYVLKEGYENFSVYNKDFLESLKFADKVIVDYPSTTALFEAAAAGKPILCICADYFRILKQSRDIYGKSLKQFSSIEDAISVIREFLYADPKEYIVEIPFSKNGFIDAFKEISVMGKRYNKEGLQ